MSLVDRWGGGVSQAFGTGGRDLSEAVGGVTMLDSLGILAEDPDTRVIVLVSKPPAPGVAAAILERAAGVSKPVVVCFLGHNVNYPDRQGIFLASTLEETAQTAVFLEQGCKPELSLPDTAFRLSQCHGYLRGLFSGGTLADEALLIVAARIADVFSNLGGAAKLENPHRSLKNTIVDMGDDEFTVGRPHPMLDFSYRLERFRREAADPEVGVILMDVVLGFGSHPDPAGELGPVVRDALRQARSEGRDLKVVISLVGTDSDPQSYSVQAERLRAAGAVVASTNAQAARLAATLLADQKKEGTPGGVH
jgi:FdrA protein